MQPGIGSTIAGKETLRPLGLHPASCNIPLGKLLAKSHMAGGEWSHCPFQTTPTLCLQLRRRKWTSIISPPILCNVYVYVCLFVRVVAIFTFFSHLTLDGFVMVFHTLPVSYLLETYFVDACIPRC